MKIDDDKGCHNDDIEKTKNIYIGMYKHLNRLYWNTKRMA